MADMPDDQKAPVIACADLVDRAGAREFEIGYTGDDANPRWYAHAKYRGARLTSEGHALPADAALGLAARILQGGTCRCGRTVTLTKPGNANRCRWTLDGERWEPGCDAPSVEMEAGLRGDIAAMHAEMRKGQR